MSTKEMPEVCTEEMLEYLDDLREEGVVNMFGAGSYLEAEFGLDKREARTVLKFWMDTFSERNPE